MNKFEQESKILDNVNQWIFNCDTKVSIVLATLSVFLTVLLSSDIGKGIVNVIRMSISNKTVCSVAYIIVLLVGVILLAIGIFKLIKVLIPTINVAHPSIMFFGSVAKFVSFDEYKSKYNSSIDGDMEEDILQQIFAASQICSLKFKNQRQGLIASLVGMTIILAWAAIGFLVYYI